MDAIVILAIGMIVVIGGILKLKLHPFLALILGAITVSVLTSDVNIQKYAESMNLSSSDTQALLSQTTGKKIADGLGKTAGKIGILIAMAAIIGKCLLESGGAERIIRSTLSVLGEKRITTAFMGSGFILAVPVYFDTVFYLMIPLAKSAAAKIGKNFGLYTMAIIAGATMAHSLVPPTPGPLLVAGELDVDLGKMMLGGIALGGCTLITGALYASWANKKFPIPLRDSADSSVEDLEKSKLKNINELPPLWLSLLPIMLPIGLIAGNTIIPTFLPKFVDSTESIASLLGVVRFLGNKDIALTISALIALWLLARQIKDRKKLADAVQKAISGAGMIILITAAGGAFGAMLQQTGIGPDIKELATKYQISILPLAFFVTMLIRTAQGSATVAMITSVGIFSGMAGDLDFDALYLALAIGCGSKPFPWMNDSGFWVICKMSGMTEKETLKTSSTLMSLMALSGLIIIMIASSILPKF